MPARYWVQPQRPASATARRIRDLTANGIHVERGGLVDLVDPVAVKQMRVAAPAVLRRPGGIIVRIVIAGHVYVPAIRDIAVIFLFEGVAVILEMVEDIERAMPWILD